MNEKDRKYIQDIANKFREQGINTEVQLIETKLSNQLKYASRKAIPWTVIIGEDEIQGKQMQLKNMLTGEQSLVSLEEAIASVKS